MVLIFIVVIIVLVLIVLGLGLGGTFEAIQNGWEKVPTQNITDNFKEATEKSITDISSEIKP